MKRWWQIVLRGGLLGVFAVLFHLMPHDTVCDTCHDHDDDDGSPTTHLVCHIGAVAVIIPDAPCVITVCGTVIRLPEPSDEQRPLAAAPEPDPPPNIAA